MEEKVCINCGNIIPKSYLSDRYCSFRCNKNFWNKEYRKNNKDKVNAYNRKYKSQCSRRPLNKKRRSVIISENDNKCARCNSTDNLNVHHIKPLNRGGTHELNNLLVLCFTCHMEWEKRFKNFWLKNNDI